MFVRPIRRFVLLVDEQPNPVDGGLVLPDRLSTDRLDYVVAAVGSLEPDPGFGVGDTVVLNEPTTGRKVRLDGVVYRVVRVSDIVGVLDEE